MRQSSGKTGRACHAPQDWWYPANTRPTTSFVPLDKRQFLIYIFCFLSTYLARLRDLERCLQRWNFHVSKSYLSITSALWSTNRGIPLRPDARHVRYLLNATMPSRMPLPRRYDRGVKIGRRLSPVALRVQSQQTNPASAELFRAGSRNNVVIETFASSPTPSMDLWRCRRAPSGKDISASHWFHARSAFIQRRASRSASPSTC